MHEKENKLYFWDFQNIYFYNQTAKIVETFQTVSLLVFLFNF